MERCEICNNCELPQANDKELCTLSKPNIFETHDNILAAQSVNVFPHSPGDTQCGKDLVDDR